MTAIIDIKTNFIPSKYEVVLYNIYDAFAIKKDETEFLDLGKVYVFFEIMPKDIRMNTIFEPTNEARDWFAVHRERLSLIPDGLKATKHIHTYPKDATFPMHPEGVDPYVFIEKIKGSKEFRSILKEHMQFIKNKAGMRLFHEYEISYDGYSFK